MKIGSIVGRSGGRSADGGKEEENPENANVAQPSGLLCRRPPACTAFRGRRSAVTLPREQPTASRRYSRPEVYATMRQICGKDGSNCAIGHGYHVFDRRGPMNHFQCGRFPSEAGRTAADPSRMKSRMNLPGACRGFGQELLAERFARDTGEALDDLELAAGERL